MTLNRQTDPSSISVLVAEDDVVFRRVMEWTLRRSGFKVTAAPNGAVALETLRANCFDFMVTDHQMPVLTGLEMLRIADEERLLRPGRTVLCTAKGFELDVVGIQERFELAAILSKPFSPKELVTLVAEAVQQTIVSTSLS